jgi:prepilin-type N-terminal cleavage/methylation domain-containing protein
VSNLLKKEKGFTLIEIVLVLAIAGLLLVIVFLAVSGAQRSRRDTQRKNDLSRIAAQVESYASNNGGKYPTPDAAAGTGFQVVLAPAGAYNLSNANDPSSGNTYTYAGKVVPSGSTSAGVLYTIGAAGVLACNGDTMTGARNFKVEMSLEQGVACVDNH